ncbi:helix-turn-helix domain-containing protein [Frankia sp. Cj3]|uniref:helix-turn-helix domain-containing protein n=1 Tax=Frankia sp. Cj3 TaxID=2880976 RepID=UPI0035B1B393
MTGRAGVRVEVADRDLLRWAIGESGLSLRSVAARVGCSHGQIGHLTSGRQRSCRAELAVAIASAIGCGFDEIFTTASKG